MHNSYPKRIILSRKGWDSKAGGRPSPLFPDGTHASLPIPDEQSGISYQDLQTREGISVGELVEDLTRRRKRANSEVHLDPDLTEYTMRRSAAFVPAFGQCGAAQSHLANEGVSEGDLFLFFGLYRPAVKRNSSWCYAGRDLHMVFGWLQIGTILKLTHQAVPPVLARHPHVLRSSIVKNELGARRDDNNTLYVARSRLSFDPEIAGAGVFGAFDNANFDDPRRLTFQDNNCSLWRLPSFFSGMSNMGEQPSPKNGWWYPQRRGPGQEFVLNTQDCEVEARAWLPGLFNHAERQKAARA